MIDAITSMPPLAAYALIALLVFGEAAIFIGFVLPGETAVVLGGFLASRHDLEIVTLCALVFVSAVLGDTVGYEVGKQYGPRLLRLKVFARHQGRMAAASEMLRRRGGPAVFLGRFTAFFRAVMPGLAGLSQMRYRTFLPWNALGGLVWGVGFSLVGYFAGESYDKVATQIGRGTAIAVAVLVIAALVVWHFRRRRAESS
jgi:membrane protein DedA with SNARE-associated domain